MEVGGWRRLDGEWLMVDVMLSGAKNLSTLNQTQHLELSTENWEKRGGGAGEPHFTGAWSQMQILEGKGFAW